MIYTTHDIDWVSPLHPFSVAKAFTHGKKWLGFGKIVQPGLFVRHIGRLLEHNQQHGIEAIWLAGAPLHHTFKKFGLRYTADCPTYKKIVAMLNESRVEVGLHSVSTESFSGQVNELTALTGKPIHYHRSHYLKYDEESLYRNLQQHGIRTDFSLGNARKVSMPAQIPALTHGINCIPTVLFDNAFFFMPPQEAIDRFRSVISEAADTGKDVAVLFHPENFAVNPALWDYYREVTGIITSAAHNTPKG